MKCLSSLYLQSRSSVQIMLQCHEVTCHHQPIENSRNNTIVKNLLDTGITKYSHTINTQVFIALLILAA
jgi:hypothetical protein